MRILSICTGLALAIAFSEHPRWRPRRRSTSSSTAARRAGVAAAVQAKRMGKSVVVVSPDKHLGGLTSGGLGLTDTGNKAVIGGLSREFYHRVCTALRQARRRGCSRSAEAVQGQQPAIDGERRDVDLRAARRRAGLRGLGRRNSRSPSSATSGSTAPRA